MKTEMTDRDKKLLVFLALFVIVVGIGYWGIYPMVKDILHYNTKITEEQNLKETNELKIAGLPLLEKENESMEEEIRKAKEDYYPMMTSDEIDKLFTGMALDYNLYAYKMDIRMEEEEAVIEPYVYSEKNYKLKEEEAMEVEPLSDIIPSTGIYAVQVSMRLGSDSEEDLQSFINDLSVDESRHLIKEYSWEDNSRNVISLKSNGAYDMDIEYEKILNITIDIYMCQE